MIEPPPPTELTQLPGSEDDEEVFQNGSSAKIEQLIHLLTLIPHSEKSLVFSQFTSFLDKVYINCISLSALLTRSQGRGSIG